MSTVSAHDVARELRDRLPNAGDLKIHKLLYYVQGWHLAWNDSAVYIEPIEAWANGPVVADLWRAEKRATGIPSQQPVPSSALEAVGFVVSRYGRFSGKELIRLTHAEAPWREASERAGSNDWSNQEISHLQLKQFFVGELSQLSDSTMIDQIPENEMLRNRFMPEQISNAGDGSPDSAQDIEQRLAELRR